VAVAEQLSFQRAADTLGVNRSSVSRRVRLVEQRLGLTLFKRSYAGVQPTAAGARFLATAREILSQLDNALQTANSAHAVGARQVRIAILSSMGSGYLRDLIRQYGIEFPDVELQIVEGDPREQIAQLQRGELDVVFVVDGTDIEGCDVEPLWTERFFVALPERHALSKSRQVRWETLRNEHFIMRRCERGPHLCERVFRRLSAGGAQPKVRKLDVGREAIMHLVAIESHLSLTSESTTATRFPGVVFRPIADSDATVQFSAVWSRSNANPAFHSFLTLARRRAGKRVNGSADGSTVKALPASGPIISAVGFVGGLGRKLGLWT
jgi:DNA-binding transcriptional LysR family regulator